VDVWQVRRNMERFEGDDFMFELTRDELSRCQFGTLNNKEVKISSIYHLLLQNLV
jgi:hypothetical protein